VEPAAVSVSPWAAVVPSAVLPGVEGTQEAKDNLEACLAAQGPTAASRGALTALKAQKQAVAATWIIFTLINATGDLRAFQSNNELANVTRGRARPRPAARTYQLLAALLFATFVTFRAGGKKSRHKYGTLQNHIFSVYFSKKCVFEGGVFCENDAKHNL
jgi:hypothetical protein